MGTAQKGDTVKVHYTGKLRDGRPFDTSEGREPLEFAIGSGALIRGFEAAVVGMNPGETRTATVGPEDAYGPYRPEMVFEIERGRLPDGLEPQPGQQLQMRGTQGSLVATITEVSNASVTLDANHPLAGQDLMFEIQLVEIV